MALIGPDGNDMLEVMADGVSSSDWVAINARAFTEHGREAFDPTFGVGISAMLGTPALTTAEIRRRWVDSLAGADLDIREITVSIEGTAYRIELTAEVNDGVS